MNSHETKQEKPAVIALEDARSYFEDGARRWRKPHKKMIDAHRDADSMDFRGVRAAFAVTRTLPQELDAEGKRLPVDPKVAKEHYDLGLTAIQQSGLLPLDDRFVNGYQRWADAVVRDEARSAQESLNIPHADSSVL